MSLKAVRLALSAACLHLLRGAAGTRNEMGALTAAGKLVMLEATGVDYKSAFVDAGSTGCKVFAYCRSSTDPSAASKKLSTTCKQTPDTVRFTSKGIAALQYTADQCGPWPLSADPAVTRVGPSITAADQYVENLFRVAASVLSELPAGCEDHRPPAHPPLPPPPLEVPMMATAGMRLLSQAKNAEVWALLCDKTSASGRLKTPAAGGRCGTIPGTLEAYFEWVAHVVKSAATPSAPSTPPATFTIGGASAQIVLPLKTAADVTRFQELIATIRAEINCQALRLADGTPAPKFSTPVVADPTTGCLADYIAYKPWADVHRDLPDGRAVANGLVRADGSEPIQGLGLISFLSLRAQGTLIAGGIEEIQVWARAQRCDGGGNTFAQCTALLDAALSRDVLWKSVKEYVRRTRGAGLDSFWYNTAAANPFMAGLDLTKTDQHQGWSLKAMLDATCAPQPPAGAGEGEGAHFGSRGNTCMRAYWTSLYVTAFFVDLPADRAKLHFGDLKDWADGASIGALLETHERSVAALLDVPLRHFSASYAEGAAAHFAASGES